MKQNIIYGLLATLLVVLCIVALFVQDYNLLQISIVISAIGSISVGIHFWRIVFSELAAAIRLIRDKSRQ